jgi:hypothetical protein
MGIVGSVEDGRQSAEHIIPELQDLAVGDVIAISPDGGYSVVEIRPEPGLVLFAAVGLSSGRPIDCGGDAPGSALTSSWTWFLDEIDERTTRLIERIRIGYSPSLANAVVIRGIIEPGSFLMERKTLRGIKRRAESASLRRAWTRPGDGDADERSRSSWMRCQRGQRRRLVAGG